MKLLGIDAMAVALPHGRRIVDLADESGLDHSVIKAALNNGLCMVPVSDSGSFVAFALESVNALLSADPQARVGIRLVLLTHSSPLLCPADNDVLGELLDRAGLSGADSFAFTGQPCAVLHAAVRCGLDALEDDESGSVLILGVDRANHPAERMFFGSAMGDVSVALLLGRDSRRQRIIGTYQHTELYAYNGELSNVKQIQAFRDRNPLLIRSAIEQCLEIAGYHLYDLTAIIPHTPYLSIWDTMARLLRYPRERILTDYITETGHLSSNDSFVHFHRAQESGRIRPGDLALLINPGFGGSRGCTLIRV